ncbi:hypothetical protein F8M41_001847 [Gigaspora margarita]|uniref:Uncharacterized protein n=1 Tax=Gigaspora margarita TaxID=4874 RepID=A0A8H3XGS5_GIGMA|nr:hypothetical protein F8M41_001847 [Gigaspora margarita]
MRSKLLNVHQNVTNKFEENVEDENVDNVKDYQPKTEESVQDNRNSETNVEGKKSSGKDKKLSTRVTCNSKKVNYSAANSDNE